MPTISVAELQEIFGGLSNERLHTRLQGFDAQEGAYGLMIGLVEYLIRNRGEKPTAVHYNALIRANADPDFGSVEAVRALLTEMKESEIPLDSAICHSVLLVYNIRDIYDYWLINTTGPCNPSRLPSASPNHGRNEATLVRALSRWMAQSCDWLSPRSTIRDCYGQVGTNAYRWN